MEEREKYNQIKKDILDAIESIRSKIPEAAEYLENHFVMDDEKMTFCYTGDDRLKIEPLF